MVPKNHYRKSHSGIPGSKAACAYPGHFRGLPRPSSALKPSHSPDGVAYRAFGGVCLALSDETHIVVQIAKLIACAWCHYG